MEMTSQVMLKVHVIVDQVVAGAAGFVLTR
jgi:hypothetical protein